jgi:DNA-binding CsgD family transcriptional regulator
MEEGFSIKKRSLLVGLSDLVAADCWVSTLMPPNHLEERSAPQDLMHGGFSEDRFSVYQEAAGHPDMKRLNTPFIEEVQVDQSHATWLRQQLDPNDTLPALSVGPLWEEADIAPMLYSCHPSPDRGANLIALFRRTDDRQFSRQESRIAHIVLSEVPWLHAQELPDAQFASDPTLSPRLRTTLNYLLEGLGRKQIAGHLGISKDTVSGYVKEVYRLYKVRSHAELMKLFRDSEGGNH